MSPESLLPNPTLGVGVAIGIHMEAEVSQPIGNAAAFTGWD